MTILGVALVVLVAWMAYKGWRRLRQPVRRADASVNWGATLASWAGGVVLVLPASVLLFLLVSNIVGQQQRLGALQDRYRAQREQLLTTYHLDTATSTYPRAGDYRFDLSLRADSTFSLATTLPRYQKSYAGRWRLVDTHNGKLAVELRGADAFAQHLETQDLDSLSYLMFYKSCAAPYDTCYVVRLRKEGAAEQQARPVATGE
ncbi:hypothetical protein B0919_07530 [Hymenobacter sp. CRA2]|nr:hypothetical protein B0919_07530 [Hymenobacter sp. CRA2]